MADAGSAFGDVTMIVLNRSVIKTVCLGAVSYLVLTIILIEPTAAETSLPPITVEAPSKQTVKRTATLRRSTPGTRAAARHRTASPNPIQPVPTAFHVPAASQVNSPPAPFAGGQVASGTQVGILGNKNIFDTPFSVAGYTKDLMQSIQAKSVSDVLERDPAITVGSNSSYYDILSIRGFPYNPNDVALNGLYGIAPATTYPVELFDRIEVLRGPSQLLYGYPPLGSLGGVVNLVPKHATDNPIAQITGTYWSNAMGGVAVDVGQRYGEFKEWGVRVNALYRDGTGAVDRFSEEAAAVSLGLDYRGERVRASFDYFHNYLDQPNGQRTTFGLLPGVSVPSGVRNTNNFAQPYEFYNANYDYGVARVEADVLDNVTVFGAFGAKKQSATFVQALANTVIDNAGTVSQFETGGPFQINTTSAEVGVRSEFDTGPLKHKVVFAAQDISYDRRSALTLGTALTNIYNPFPSPNPGVSVDAAGPALPLTKIGESSLSLADTLSVLHDRFALTVGARQQWINQDDYGLNTGIVADTENNSKTSPAIGLVAKPIENVTLYANYIEALTQVTPAPIGTANAGQGFAPVVTQQKEVGVKVNWWGTLGTTLAAYDITSPSVFTNPVSNVYGPLGLQRNRGVELTVFGEPTKGVRVLAGFSSIDGRLETTLDSTTTGKKAPGVPDYQGSVGADIDIPGARGLTISPLAVFVGESYYDPQNTQRVPAYVRADLGASYTFANMWSGKPIVVRGRITNLFGANYLTNVPGAAGGLSIGAPRAYMVSTTFNF
jgi:iron complex outermembrane recepter protein